VKVLFNILKAILGRNFNVIAGKAAFETWK
jgi:hypothetical protein